MDLAQFAGVDYEEVLLDGTIYKVGRLTMREWALFQAWIKANAPRPLGSLRSEDMEGLSKEDRGVILRAAFEENKAWPPRIGSQAWFKAIDTPGGHAELLRAILGKFQPEITLDRCEALAETLDLTGAVMLTCHALGVDPDPKSPPPTVQGANRRQRRRERRRTGSGPSPTSSPATGAGPATRSST